MELTICPNCPEKAIRLGCCFETNLPVYWCPYCGSIKPCTETWMTPMKSDPKYSKYLADKYGLLKACKLAIEDRQCAQMCDGPHEGCPCWYCQCQFAITKAEKGELV